MLGLKMLGASLAGWLLLFAAAEERMGVPQWAHMAAPGEPWPIHSFQPAKTIRKRMAGNESCQHHSHDP